jgi:ribosome recycling factor
LAAALLAPEPEKHMADDLNGVYKDAESKMSKAIESTRSEFSSIRTGRAAPSLLDRLHVEAYGSSVPLKQVASVSSPDGRSLQVSAFDKSTVGAIRKAIETSDLGLNPNIDGQTIRLSIPPLTEERRKDLVKIVKKKGEDGKVAIRNIRHKAADEVKALQKAATITEDENKRAADHIQKLTDKFIKQIDELVGHKEKEIMEV